MAEHTNISWADMTFSPWSGCAKVSPACDGCYAEHMMATRMHRVEWGAPGQGVGTRSIMSDDYWRKPLVWNRQAQQSGVTPWVFPSLCDPFDTDVPELWHAMFHQLILETPHVFWLLLTKRIGNFDKVDRLGRHRLYSARNWAIGSTFCNQAEWDRDWKKLRDAHLTLGARFPFASIEPMLGPVDMLHVGWMPAWVIAGGETNQGRHRAREPDPEWFRELRRQCLLTGTIFHFKQWGDISRRLKAEGHGGNRLDGRIYNERPQLCR